MSSDRLHLSKDWLQWFFVIAGFGSLLGGILCPLLIKRYASKLLLTISLCILALMIILEPLSSWLSVTATIRFLVGIFSALLMILTSQLLIQLVKTEFVGRVNGTMTPLFSGALLIGISISGFLLNTTSLLIAFAIASLFVLLAGLVSCFLPLPSQKKEPV